MRFKTLSFLLIVLSLLATACGENSLKSSGGNKTQTLDPVYHNFSECPRKDELPKMTVLHDIQSYSGGGAVLMVLGDNQLNIWIDGQIHSETYKTELLKDGSESRSTLVYRAGCRNKGIDAEFFEGKKRGSWKLEAVKDGYQFTNMFDGREVDSKFYPKDK